MKLSEIVSYKNLLDSLSSESAAEQLLNEISSMIDVVKASNVQIPNAIDQLTQAHKQVSQSVDAFAQQFPQLKQSVQQLIEQQFWFNIIQTPF